GSRWPILLKHCTPMTKCRFSARSAVDERTAQPAPCAFDKMHAIRSSCDRMAMREAQIDALATHLVQGLIDRGVIKPKGDVKELIACVVELMSANFETEAQIDEEADKIAEAEARRDTRLDVTRLRSLIRQRLAEKKNFTL